MSLEISTNKWLLEKSLQFNSFFDSNIVFLPLLILPQLGVWSLLSLCSLLNATSFDLLRFNLWKGYSFSIYWLSYTLGLDKLRISFILADELPNTDKDLVWLLNELLSLLLDSSFRFSFEQILLIFLPNLNCLSGDIEQKISTFGLYSLWFTILRDPNSSNGYKLDLFNDLAELFFSWVLSLNLSKKSDLFYILLSVNVDWFTILWDKFMLEYVLCNCLLNFGLLSILLSMNVEYILLLHMFPVENTCLSECEMSSL